MQASANRWVLANTYSPGLHTISFSNRFDHVFVQPLRTEVLALGNALVHVFDLFDSIGLQAGLVVVAVVTVVVGITVLLLRMLRLEIGGSGQVRKQIDLKSCIFADKVVVPSTFYQGSV